MLVNLITKDGTGYNYYITETFVIEPTEMWVTEDFHDDRVTMVTCTDNGERRLVVIAKMMSGSQYKTYSDFLFLVADSILYYSGVKRR